MSIPRPWLAVHKSLGIEEITLDERSLSDYVELYAEQHAQHTAFVM